MIEWTIRPAAPTDIAAVLPLMAEHAAFERLDYMQQARLDMLPAALVTTPPRLYLWLAQVDDAIVGYASATLDFSTLDRATYLHMDCLFVRTGWRGHGIGRGLWHRLRDFAYARGCLNMQWQTPDWNEDAARFYRRLGAKEWLKRRYTLRLDAGQ
jgi:GNAT superfamily N-acetyltransferase